MPSATFELMRYTVNLVEADVDPREWAKQREAEGWHALWVADHVFTATRPQPHVWVTAAGMAVGVAPRLVGSVGGLRTIREVTPHLDRVELKVQSAAKGLEWLGTVGISSVSPMTPHRLEQLAPFVL